MAADKGTRAREGPRKRAWQGNAIIRPNQARDNQPRMPQTNNNSSTHRVETLLLQLVRSPPPPPDCTIIPSRRFSPLQNGVSVLLCYGAVVLRILVEALWVVAGSDCHKHDQGIHQAMSQIRNVTLELAHGCNHANQSRIWPKADQPDTSLVPLGIREGEAYTSYRGYKPLGWSFKLLQRMSTMRFRPAVESR